MDKTDLVYKLAQNNVCFLSRPRRFGKSLLISTLDSYFKGRKDLLKEKYDGYHFSENISNDIYNPFSIINALKSKKLENYWYKTGTPAYLVNLLEGSKISINNTLEKSYAPEYFVDYRGDKEDPLAMLYQSGYITIKEYDSKFNEYKLDFLNDEVRKSFVSLIGNSYFKSKNYKVDSFVTSMAKLMDKGDIYGVRDLFTSFLSSIPYDADKNLKSESYETHFTFLFYVINRILGAYTTYIEKENSNGRADIIIETDDYVYIFEFKVDKSASEALDQIEDKGYATPYKNDKRKLFKVGVCISSETKTVSEWEVVE